MIQDLTKTNPFCPIKNLYLFSKPAVDDMTLCEGGSKYYNCCLLTFIGCII